MPKVLDVLTWGKPPQGELVRMKVAENEIDFEFRFAPHQRNHFFVELSVLPIVAKELSAFHHGAISAHRSRTDEAEGLGGNAIVQFAFQATMFLF